MTEGIKLPIQGKNNFLRKGDRQIVGKNGSKHHQTSGEERKKEKEYLRRTRKLLEKKLYHRYHSN